MGYSNPPIPWGEIERRLSDRSSSSPGQPRAPRTGRVAAGRDPSLSYAELHCHSAFSFLDGSSMPEDLVEEATRLGLEALALTDHHGLYGVVRFAQAARTAGLPSVFGAEVTIGSTAARQGPPDPDGRHLVILARDPTGYAQLSTLLSKAQMAGEKGRPRLGFADIAEAASGRARGHWAVLTGCRKGVVPSALVERGPSAASRELRTLVAAFGVDNTFVELWDHGNPLDSNRNDAMVSLAVSVGAQPVVTNNVHYATPSQRRLAGAMAAVRARRSMEELDGWLPAAGMAHLRSPAEQHRRFARYPGAVAAAADLGRSCAFDLSLVAPSLPPFPCPPGDGGMPQSEPEYLRHLTEQGATRRYGPRHAERVHGAWAQIDHELGLICALGFCGYFLVVWDLVEFCRANDILCQGRGSAANSAVCYALGITNADAVGLGLLFERFMSPEREGPPDIDIDIESDRREEVIQYVYERHGRSHAAQVANVITYRARSAVRDAARALGFSAGRQDAFSKQVDRWRGAVVFDSRRAPGPSDAPASSADRGPCPGAAVSDSRRAPGPSDATTGEATPVPLSVLELAGELEGLPRHLGIHSGGMVICDRPVVEVCPTEWARMENRSVLQWDKDDCAAAGLVKFDLLGLGMLSAIHYAIDLVDQHHDVTIDLAMLPQQDEVYEMLCRADTVGVFQVESRAQMATLPRLAPRCFYDLVVEVALIRPGPIQGGSVHPYIRRRKGEEPVTYLHPLLRNSLEKTLGVPLFQEQLMQMAIDVAGFSAAEADRLRQAMASKRSERRMAELRERFDAGLARNGISGEVAVAIWEKLAAFANYGFPESHSVSFAYLVYASSWLKYHYPAAFCAALLNAQPMGFYSPQSLTQDARRHGVKVLTPDLHASGWNATLEALPANPGAPAYTLPASTLPASTQPAGRGASMSGPVRHGVLSAGEVWVRDDSRPETWGWGGPAVRLGLSSVRGIGDDLAREIVSRGPYSSPDELARRVGLDRTRLEALATAGAFGCFEGDDGRPLERREALWVAGAAARSRPGRLPGMVEGTRAPRLPGMDDRDTATADLWATGVAPDGHPTRFLREELTCRGVVPVVELAEYPDGERIRVAGVVTHRQRPETAGGITFVNLEDETGLVNVVCSPGCWQRYRGAAVSAPALLVRGMLERSADGVVNVVADRLEALSVPATVRSRDFR